MYKNLSVFDADSHVMEPPDFWSDYIAPEFKDRQLDAALSYLRDQIKTAARDSSNKDG